MDEDPVSVVRDGYDAVSHLYRGDDDPPDPHYRRWLERLSAGLPDGGSVLDIGCGNGVPVARTLARSGFAVTGIDLSPVQISRARTLVPRAAFVCGDVTEARWEPAGFDAITCLYSMIHIPLARQPELVASLARWTAPGGLLVLVTGSRAWTGTEQNWLGGGRPMWWSHTDADTYRRWLQDTGWTLLHDEFVPEGNSGHQAFFARRGR